MSQAAELVPVDAIVFEAARDGATLAHVNALAAEVQQLRRKLGDWMRFVPKDAEPMEAYRKGDLLVVCGTPSDTEDENDPTYHSCDHMGCSSVSHVIFRQRVQFT